MWFFTGFRKNTEMPVPIFYNKKYYRKNAGLSIVRTRIFAQSERVFFTVTMINQMKKMR